MNVDPFLKGYGAADILYSRRYEPYVENQGHSCIVSDTEHAYRGTSSVTRHPTFRSTRDGVPGRAVPWPMDWSRWSAELAIAVTGAHSPRFP